MDAKKKTMNYEYGSSPATTKTPPPYPKGTSSEDILRDIDYTRSHMDDIVDELAQRLNPREMINYVYDVFKGETENARKVRENIYRTGRSVVDAFRGESLPIVLIGTGVTLLTMRARSSGADGQGHGNALKEKYHEAVDAVRGKADHLKHRVSESSSSARASMDEKRSAIKENMQHRGSRITRRSQRMTTQVNKISRDYPLVMGLGAFAAGLLAASVIPTSRKEDELMHPYAEQTKEEVKKTGEEALEKAKETGEELKSETKKSYEETSSSSTEPKKDMLNKEKNL